ncbi:MAG: VOC family protein [Thermoanaerobaculia bacterium]
MGISEEEIFGRSSRAEPATPGSYGLPPRGFRLPCGTRLGPVRLQVADLDRSLAYYGGTLGLRTLETEPGRALLGVRAPAAATPAPRSIPTSTPTSSDTPLVELRERRGARSVPTRGRTGLFHFAILLPDRPALGRFVRHLGEIGARAGAADHRVSEALYLQDPDNLGIEVYADRPRDDWRRVGRELKMATDPLDLAGLLDAAGEEPWDGLPARTVLGHVHLHVGDLAAAAAFYPEGLGFDRTVWDYPGVLFLGAGGYHHHLGTNVWAGAQAPPPADGEAQLLEWTIELPDAASLASAAESLERAGYARERVADGGGEPGLAIRDPWGTRARLRVATPAAG